MANSGYLFLKGGGGGQAFVDDGAEGAQGLRGIFVAPEVASNGSSMRSGCNYFCHHFQSALQIIALRPASGHYWNGTCSNNLTIGFNVAREGNFDHVGATFDAT